MRWLVSAVTVVLIFSVISLQPTWLLAWWPEASWGELVPHQEHEPYVRKPVLYSTTLADATVPYTGLILVGDVLLARNVEVLMHRYGANYPLNGFALKNVRPGSAIVGNFEASVPEVHQPTPAQKLRFSVASTALPILREAGFTHMSLANNHTDDFGITGMTATRDALRNAKLVSFGHPNKLTENSISYITLDNTRIALIGLHTLTNRPNATVIQTLLTQAKTKSDLQLVYVHWGDEYEVVSSNTQRQLARELVAAGADVIVGHHPHVVQEIDVIDGVPVFYSLGNYIFDQYFSREVQESLVLELSIGEELVVTLSPVSSAGSLSQPKLLTGHDRARFLHDLAQRSNKILRPAIESGVVTFPSLVAQSSKVVMINR